MLAHDGSNNFSSSTMISKFTQVNALPCAQVKSAIGDGYGYAHATQCALGMCWHVIGTFKDVIIVGLIFLYQMIHYLFHVGPYIGVGILIYRECTTGVLYK